MNTIETLMISTSYPADLDDWRGLFIRHLVGAFARRDDVALHLWAPPGEIPPNVQSATTRSEQQWLASLMAAGGIAHLMRTRNLRGLTSPLRLLAMLARSYRRNATLDMYHVNWLQNALPLPRNGRPALITVLGSDFQLLGLPGMRPLLRHAFRGRAVALCPNADWMVPTLEAAFGDMAHVVFVPFGIDPCWFDVDRELAENGTRKWMCVSRLTKAKLGDLLEHGVDFFSAAGRELHLFGPMQETIDLPPWVHYHGPISPQSLCREWFPHAFGLISLSQHAEGRPQVMLEAMAAGLPIIASDIPPHANLVQHRQTGWLCKSSGQLAEALAALEVPATNLLTGAAARRWVNEHIGTWDDCAARYLRVYRSLLEISAQ
ncbi:MAG: glycosyltransferase family 4 protein [Luteimonas sp.]